MASHPYVDELAGAAAAADRALCSVVEQVIGRRQAIADETGVTIEVWLASVTRLATWEARALLRAADVLPAMPATLQAWRGGALSWSAVRTITARTSRLSRDLVAEADALVGRAVEELDGCGVDAVVDTVDTWHAAVTSAQRERAEARDHDVLHAQPRLDGSGGTIWGDFGAVSFATITDRLDTRRVRPELEPNPDGDPEVAAANATTLGRARAAALVDLCASGPDGARREPLVIATVSLETLLLMDDLPAQLRTKLPGGALHVTARTARDLANAGAGLRLVVEDGEGVVVGVGRSMRLAPGWLEEAQLVWHATCTFPTCRDPARLCDTDHATEFGDGGPTDANNLHPTGRAHHKTRHGWKVDVADNGDTTWTHLAGATLTQPAIPTLQRLVRATLDGGRDGGPGRRRRA